MQHLFSKFNGFCMLFSHFMLDNGAGRARPVYKPTSTDPSGFSTFINGILKAVGDALLDFGEFLLRCLARLSYFVIKLCLNIMDFMNIVIKNLSGQASSYSLKDNSNLAENDILFQFLFNELTLKIFRAVLIFSFLLLIIFTIMAIVKNEWQNHIAGKQNSIKKIFRKVLISLFTTLIVPFVVIVGIVFSNVVLASAMSAVSGQTGSYSLGAQIFTSSSYDANRYRVYAQEGKKVPIVFDYNGGFENTISTEFPTITEESTKKQEEQLKGLVESGEYTAGESAYDMFKNETFFTFDTVRDDSAYYQIYDGGYLKTKQVEYYAMADFLDFALSSGGTFYVTNAEKVYRQVIDYIAEYNLPDPEKDPDAYDYIFAVLDNLIAYDENDKEILNTDNEKSIYETAKAINRNDIVVDRVDFTVYYNKPRAQTLVTSGLNEDGSLTYSSMCGSTDEVTGAKYLLCHKVEVGEDGEFFYLPLRLGDKVNGIVFKSNFIASAPKSEDGESTLRSESVFLARGVFTAAGYPTAIREQGQDVVYYRQTPIAPSFLNYSEIFNYTENTGGKGEGTNFVAGAVEFLSGVDIHNLVPDLEVNLNFLTSFTKSEDFASTLDKGKFMVNYSFVGANLNMPNLYDEIKINYIVLIFACVSLFMSLFYIIWALIQRLFEITLLWVTTPAWIAKFPIEGADNIGENETSFRNWKNRMIERVVALFSIYIALAVVLMLLPVVFNFDYITTFDIPETNLFNIFNADAANLVIKTAFVLVLLAFLRVDKGAQVGADGKVDKGHPNDDAHMMGAPRIIERILMWSKGDISKGYLGQVGADVVKEVKDLASKATVFTPAGALKAVKGTALNVARTAINAIPGKNIADRLIDHSKKSKKFKRDNDNMLNTAQADLLSKDTTKDIEAAAKELSEATHDHSYMEEFQTARKDYWRQTPADVKRNRGKAGKTAERMANVAKFGGGTKTKLGKLKRKERKVYKEKRKSRGI